MFDTNIILDVLLKREPHVTESLKTLKLAEAKRITSYMAVNSITDIFYILEKYSSEKAVILEAIVSLVDIIDICDVLKSDVIKALGLKFDDYEDALISVCAKRLDMDYIITRDKKGFLSSTVKPISPDEFNKHFI